MRLHLLAIKRNHPYVLGRGESCGGKVTSEHGGNQWLRSYVESSLSRIVNVIILLALYFVLDILGVFSVVNFIVLGLISTIILSVLDYKFRWTALK